MKYFKSNTAFFIFLFFITLTSYSQTVDWLNGFADGSNSYKGNNVVADAAGNIYSTGDFNNSGSFGSFTLTAIGNRDPYIAKTDALGNVLWAIHFGGSANFDSGIAITVDASGNNIYAAGFFTGTAVFGTFTLSSGFAGFIIKLDPAGNVIWAKQQSTNAVMNAFNLCCDAIGNVYAAGTYSGTTVFDTFTLSASGYTGFVYKADPSTGNIIWVKEMTGSTASSANGLTIDPSNNIYVAGRFDGTGYIGTFSLTSAGSNDVFVTKLNPAGNFLWAKQYGGTGFDAAGSICSNASGNIYFGGIFQGPVSFDTYMLNSGNSFVSQIDASGNIIWANKFEGMGSGDNITLYGVSCDAGGNVYSTGSFSGTASFGSTVSSTYINSDPSSHDAFISKLDATGNFVSVKKITGTGEEVGRSIICKNNKVIVTGDCGSQASIDSYTIANSRIFLVQLSTGVLGIHEYATSDSNLNVLAYPNPTKDKITISVEGEITEVSLSLINIAGVELMRQEHFDSKSETVDLSNLAPGIYFLRINSGKQSSVVKVIKV